MPTTPHNKEIEAAVLSRILDPDSGRDAYLEFIEAGGNASWFLAHRALFQFADRRLAAEQSCDPIAMPGLLKEAGLLEAIGGVAGYMTILGTSPTHGYFAGHLVQLRELAFRRGALAFAADLELAASEGRENLREMLNEPVDDLIASGMAGKRARTGADAFPDWMQRWEDKLNGKTQPLLTTGIPGLDDIRGGIEEQSMVIIGAYPASGKTAMGVQMAAHALKEGRRVMFFSLEMPEAQLIDRLMVHLCGFEEASPVLEPKPGLSKAQLQKIQEAAQVLITDNLIIEDRAGLHHQGIAARAKLEHRRKPLDLIIVDFIQRVRGEGEVERRLSAVAESLQVLMKETKAQVVAMSQLNKEGSAKYAASIEEAADLMINIDRSPGEQDVSNVIIRKDRHRGWNGEPLNITLDRNRQRFVSQSWQSKCA